MLTSSDSRTRALRAADTLPVAGAVLQRTLGLFLRGDDLSVAQLADCIEQDVVIASTILAIANSVLYGRQSTISSVRQAIARVGINKARNVVLGLSVTTAFKKITVPSPWSLLQFNAHSLAAATLSDLIAQQTRPADAEWAFMAGLLHDIGLLAIATGLPEEFGLILSQVSDDAGLVEQERSRLGFTHFELGAEMVSRWNCPTPVQEAVRFCQGSTLEFARPLALGAVVKSATVIAGSQNISIVDSFQNEDVTSQVWEALEIAEPGRLVEAFQATYNELQLCAV